MNFFKTLAMVGLVGVGMVVAIPNLLAGGSIPWEWVHKEIQTQDRELIEFIDNTFVVSQSGGCMRPLIGDHATERFAPYDFLAKPKGTSGDFTFNLRFEPTNQKDQWSVSIKNRYK
jgi:hypothetical protein